MSSSYLSRFFSKNPKLFKSLSLNKNIDLDTLNESFLYSLSKSKSLFNKKEINKEMFFFKDFPLIYNEYLSFFDSVNKTDNLLIIFLKNSTFNDIDFLLNKRMQLNFYYKFFFELDKNNIPISNNVFFLIKNLSYNNFVLLKNEFLKKIDDCYSNSDIIFYLSKYIYIKFYITKEKLIKELNYLKIEYTEKDNIIFFNVANFEQSKRFGSPYWCISNSSSSFNQYILFNQNIQSFVYNFNNIETSKKIIGITYNLSGDTQNCFSYFNSNLLESSSSYVQTIENLFKKNINYLKFNFDLIFDRNIEYCQKDYYKKNYNIINIFYFIKYFLNMDFKNFNHYLNFFYLDLILFSFGTSKIITSIFFKNKISLLIEKDIYKILKIQNYELLLSLLKNNKKLCELWLTKINTDEDFYYSNFDFISFLIKKINKNKNKNNSFLSNLIINILKNKKTYNYFIELVKYKHFNNFKFLYQLKSYIREEDFLIISKIINSNKYYSNIKHQKEFNKILDYYKKKRLNEERLSEILSDNFF